MTMSDHESSSASVADPQSTPYDDFIKCGLNVDRTNYQDLEAAMPLALVVPTDRTVPTGAPGRPTSSIPPAAFRHTARSSPSFVVIGGSRRMASTMANPRPVNITGWIIGIMTQFTLNYCAGLMLLRHVENQRAAIAQKRAQQQEDADIVNTSPESDPVPATTEYRPVLLWLSKSAAAGVALQQRRHAHILARPSETTSPFESLPKRDSQHAFAWLLHDLELSSPQTLPGLVDRSASPAIPQFNSTKRDSAVFLEAAADQDKTQNMHEQDRDSETRTAPVAGDDIVRRLLRLMYSASSQEFEAIWDLFQKVSKDSELSSRFARNDMNYIELGRQLEAFAANNSQEIEELQKRRSALVVHFMAYSNRALKVPHAFINTFIHVLEGQPFDDVVHFIEQATNPGSESRSELTLGIAGKWIRSMRFEDALALLYNRKYQFESRRAKKAALNAQYDLVKESVLRLDDDALIEFMTRALVAGLNLGDLIPVGHKYFQNLRGQLKGEGVECHRNKRKMDGLESLALKMIVTRALRNLASSSRAAEEDLIRAVDFVIKFQYTVKGSPFLISKLLSENLFESAIKFNAYLVGRPHTCRIIKALASSNSAEARDLSLRLVESCINEHTVNAVMMGLVTNGETELGEKLLLALPGQHKLATTTLISSVDRFKRRPLMERFIAKKGKLDLKLCAALGLNVDENSLDIAYINLLIRRHVKDLSVVAYMVDIARSRGFAFTKPTVVHVVKALGMAGRIDDALLVLKQGPVSVQALTALVRLWGKSSVRCREDLRRFLWTFFETPGAEAWHDVVDARFFIAACTALLHAGRLDDAKAFVKLVRDGGPASVRLKISVWNFVLHEMERLVELHSHANDIYLTRQKEARRQSGDLDVDGNAHDGDAASLQRWKDLD